MVTINEIYKCANKYAKECEDNKASCTKCSFYKKQCNKFEVIPRDFIKDLQGVFKIYKSINVLKKNIEPISRKCLKSLCYKCCYYSNPKCYQFRNSPAAFYITLENLEKEVCKK